MLGCAGTGIAAGVADAGVTGSGVTGSGVTGAGVTGSGVTTAGVIGASVTGAGVLGAGVTGTGVTGAGVTGTGVTGTDVTGAGVTCAGVGCCWQLATNRANMTIVIIGVRLISLFITGISLIFIVTPIILILFFYFNNFASRGFLIDISSLVSLAGHFLSIGGIRWKLYRDGLIISRTFAC